MMITGFPGYNFEGFVDRVLLEIKRENVDFTLLCLSQTECLVRAQLKAHLERLYEENKYQLVIRLRNGDIIQIH
jgi:hypothetical protein